MAKKDIPQSFIDGGEFVYKLVKEAYPDLDLGASARDFISYRGWPMMSKMWQQDPKSPCITPEGIQQPAAQQTRLYQWDEELTVIDKSGKERATITERHTWILRETDKQ